MILHHESITATSLGRICGLRYNSQEKRKEKAKYYPPYLISLTGSGNRNQCDRVQSKITLVGVRGPAAARRERQDGRTRGGILVRDRSAGVAARRHDSTGKAIDDLAPDCDGKATGERILRSWEVVEVLKGVCLAGDEGVDGLGEAGGGLGNTAK